MVIATPTGRECFRCGGPMMRSDAREPDGSDEHCANGCDLFASVRYMRSYEAIESLSEDEMRMRGAQESAEASKARFRCTTVSCGFEGDHSHRCPVCKEHSMAPTG